MSSPLLQRRQHLGVSPQQALLRRADSGGTRHLCLQRLAVTGGTSGNGGICVLFLCHQWDIIMIHIIYNISCIYIILGNNGSSKTCGKKIIPTTLPKGYWRACKIIVPFRKVPAFTSESKIKEPLEAAGPWQISKLFKYHPFAGEGLCLTPSWQKKKTGAMMFTTSSTMTSTHPLGAHLQRLLRAGRNAAQLVATNVANDNFQLIHGSFTKPLMPHRASQVTHHSKQAKFARRMVRPRRMVRLRFMSFSCCCCCCCCRVYK